MFFFSIWILCNASIYTQTHTHCKYLVKYILLSMMEALNKTVVQIYLFFIQNDIINVIIDRTQFQRKMKHKLWNEKKTNGRKNHTAIREILNLFFFSADFICHSIRFNILYSSSRYRNCIIRDNLFTINNLFHLIPSCTTEKKVFKPIKPTNSHQENRDQASSQLRTKRQTN